MKARLLLIAAVCLLLAAAIACPAAGAPPPITTSEMLVTLERTLLGEAGEGSIAPRVLRIEELVIGKQGDGALSERIERLWAEFGGGREGVVDLDYKLKFAQWLAEGKVSKGTMVERLASLEISLIGYISRDALSSRIARMISITAGSGGIDAVYGKLAAGTAVKVILRTPLRTSFTRPGEKIDLEVGEDVFIGGWLAIPKGTTWQAEAVDPTNSDRFDLKNLIELSMSPLPALDGTPVKLIADESATAATQLASGLLICQGEKPERLGFFGLGNAVDRLLPGSKNLDIIKGTAIVLSVREDVSILSAKAK